jgi:hypothetical protein
MLECLNSVQPFYYSSSNPDQKSPFQQSLDLYAFDQLLFGLAFRDNLVPPKAVIQIHDIRIQSDCNSRRLNWAVFPLTVDSGECGHRDSKDLGVILCLLSLGFGRALRQVLHRMNTMIVCDLLRKHWCPKEASAYEKLHGNLFTTGIVECTANVIASTPLTTAPHIGSLRSMGSPYKLIDIARSASLRQTAVRALSRA